MAVLVNGHEELREMRTPVSKLQANLQAYGVSLAAILQMVQGSELKGPRFDAQVKDWAAHGALVVGDAATVQTLCLRLGEADTLAILTSLNNGQARAALIFLVSLCLCVALTVILIVRLQGQSEEGQPAKNERLLAPAVAK